jgi:DNA-binding response OmpR family regulator
MHMKTILIIEDDEKIQDMLKIFLGRNGFATVSAYSGTEGLLVHGSNVDLILLDLMLPGKSGQDVIGDLRAIKDVPIIVMTAVGDLDSKVDLFEKGADDYITKPFHNKELLMRIRARLKVRKDEAETVELDRLEINTDEHRVFAGGTEVSLSRYEFDILLLLAQNRGKIITKSRIFDSVWDMSDTADENTLNVHMSRIRKKLKEADPEGDHIETVRGVGYRIR